MNRNTGFIILGSVAVGLTLFYILKNSKSAFKRQVIFQSKKEAEKWQNFSETDEGTARIIKDYWKRGTDLDYSISDIQNPSWQQNHPWSAAFISWIMRVSGAGRHFLYSPRHADYLSDAIEEKQLNSKAKFKGYKINEIKPKETDIVCKTRLNSSATYDSLDPTVCGTDLDLYPVCTPNATLHCDIITNAKKFKRVDEDGITRKYIEAVGGNLDNKVKFVELEVDDKGYIIEDKYFAIIRNTL